MAEQELNMGNKWIKCTERMPTERKEGNGTCSENVKVLLNTGKEDTDFLINGKWVWHCRLDKIGGYPVAWKEV